MDLLDLLVEMDGGHRMSDLGLVTFPDDLAHYRALGLHAYRCAACGFYCDGEALARWHELTARTAS